MNDDAQGLGRFAERGKRFLQAWSADYDERHPTGESDTVKWVKITEDKRTVCYFLLWVEAGEVVRVGLGRKRRGQPPSPLQRAALGGATDWWAGRSPVDDPEVRAQLVRSSGEIRTGRVDADRNPGTPLTVGVRLDEQGRWVMPGFTVRGETLARVLWGARQAGMQSVPLSAVRRAAESYR